MKTTKSEKTATYIDEQGNSFPDEHECWFEVPIKAEGTMGCRWCGMPVYEVEKELKMKVYLAGPMRGIPDFNFPAFKKGAAYLRAQGHDVFNPAERDEEDFGHTIQKKGDENDFAKSVGMSTMDLRRRVFFFDCEYITKSADAIALLPGWQNSKGALAEKALSEALGLDVIYLGDAYAA